MVTAPVPLSSFKPIILIGGNGFLGRAFVAHLAAQQREVHIIGRNDWESGQAKALAKAMQSRQPVVIDLAYATVPSSSFVDPVGDFTANLGAIIRHLEFAKDLVVDRYIFVSSGGTIYGDQGDRPLGEEARKEPISPYGITKLASEHYVGMYRRIKVPTLIVRPSNIYGPGQAPFRGQGLVATAFGMALHGKPLTLFGDGSQLRDYLFIDDFCASLDATLIRGAIGQSYNLGSGKVTTAADLLSAIGSITARDGLPLTIIPADTRPFDVKANLLDVTKMRDHLGVHSHVDLEDGLERTWRWMRNQ